MKTKHFLLGWAMWLIAALFYGLDYFQHTAPSVLIEPIAHSLDVSYTTIGNIMGIYFPLYALSQIPAGYCLDRFGIRITLTFACLIVSLGLLISSSPSLTALTIGRVLIAIGSAAAFLGALKTGSTWLPKSTFPFAVGLTNTIGVLGGLLGQPFLNHMIEQSTWQHAFHLITWFGFILAVIIYSLLRAPEKPRGLLESNSHIAPILKTQAVWLLALYAGIMVGTVVNAFAELYDVVFLKYSHHISSQQAASISSMIFVGIAVGGPLHGIMANLFRSKIRWMLIANTITILMFSVIVFSSKTPLNSAIMYPLYFAVGFFVSSMLLAFSYARQYFPQKLHATAFAVINMVIGLCGFFFQELLGTMIDYFKQHASMYDTHYMFFYSFWVLLIPLIISWVLCFQLKKAPQYS